MATNRRCRCLALAVVLCCGAAPAAAQNLLQNGTFDTNVAPWEGFTSPPTFSPIDAFGLPNSGSLRTSIAHPAANAAEIAFSECVPVTGGMVLVRRYDYRLEATGGVTAIVHTPITWYNDPTCSPGSEFLGTGGFAGEVTDGAWHPSPDAGLRFTVPLEARGVRIGLVVAKFGAGGEAVAHFDNVALKVPHTCAALSHVLCLNQERFEVVAFWRTQTAAGRAAVVKLTDDTGYLWFFSPSNVEVVIKVLDACAPFGRFWVFAGGLTDVQVDIYVTDSHTGAQQIYLNDLGTPFQPVQDTNAFDTCP